MTKFEAIKQLPVERFAESFYEMVRNAGSVQKFKDRLMEEFPEDLIPALHRCSTGEAFINADSANEGEVESYLESLKGITYPEWVKLKTGIDRAFEAKKSEFERQLKFADVEKEKQMIQSQEAGRG